MKVIVIVPLFYPQRPQNKDFQISHTLKLGYLSSAKRNRNETKRNQRKRNETKSTKAKRNEINEMKRNQIKQNEID